jgi:hypothetical protein
MPTRVKNAELPTVLFHVTCNVKKNNFLPLFGWELSKFCEKEKLVSGKSFAVGIEELNT